jgi:rhodanese-related sulfurtransferase
MHRRVQSAVLQVLIDVRREAEFLSMHLRRAISFAR